MSDYSTSRPWENEPDHVEFAHAGFSCVMRRGNHGAWLAYVILPPSHPLFGLPLEDDRLQQIPSHGEWTWATDSLPNKASKAQWVIGFHCAESTDYVPAMPPEMQALFNLMCPTREYRTAEYVQFTLKRACDALAKPFPVDSTNPLNPESTAQ